VGSSYGSVIVFNPAVDDVIGVCPTPAYVCADAGVVAVFAQVDDEMEEPSAGPLSAALRCPTMALALPTWMANLGYRYVAQGAATGTPELRHLR
jgi:hypothetical protein